MAVSTSCDWKAWHGANVEGLGGHSVRVLYPFIVNTKEIKKDEEIVVHRYKVYTNPENKRKLVTAFDQLQCKYGKKQHGGCRACRQAGVL